MPTMAFELPSVAVLKEVVGGAGEVVIFYVYKNAANYFIYLKII